MEEVPGLAGQIPSLASFPDSKVRASLPSAEWEACLESWLVSIEVRLRMQDKDFAKFKFSQKASGVDFLVSVLRPVRDEGLASSKSQKERLLLKRAYMLLRRLLLATDVPFDYDLEKLLHILCLGSSAFAPVADWKATLKGLWKRNKAQLTTAMDAWKKVASAQLSGKPQQSSLGDIYRGINALLKVSPETGLTLMTGSDYLETLMEAYSSAQFTIQKLLTEHIYYCFRSLMSDGLSHGSLLLDHLYHMKSEADRTAKSKPSQPTLLSSLVCNTSFLRHLAADNSIASGKRGQSLIDGLTNYRQNTAHLHPPVASRRRKVSKGKAKAEVHTDIHIHKASQVSQVHELFPDLPNHYILRLLDHFHDDTEAVIAALLEPELLPADLRDPGSADGPSVDIDGPAHDLAPHSTPPLPPQRRNVFDGDDFDNLRISSKHLHRGRKEITIINDTEDEHARRKAAIMTALAAFDSDDDERDDTYDVADVGGTVDSTLDTDSRPRAERTLDQNPHEESLYRAWKNNQELFPRDSTTRASKMRQDLKRETAMSDEQIEGWAIMLKKDAKMQEQLEKKYSMSQSFRGNQTAFAATRWQGDTAEDSEEGENSGGGRRMGQAQIRGNRTWGRGRGGSTAGPGGEAATQAARRRKEQGRGRGGANHSRREGRARKMGRGMAGPAS
ncbi:hypothetical protein LTR10_016658 [Elasticomyces elasticus]|uniref:CUE domain-containing protein n=1 Tax=Exophiala sideris TaxID=1016849 RepID=A0ABR0JRE5_9EURO|nr:hypothetical protein LTR10_016658 [Elasticomyces elasticus]KAK5039901.1 hypothetical protein LTS07_000396 [Exophiala sideris]KAK5041453.1 hypothetical protein LTR13_002928 [Exophiala sideris]KAK5068280.1 hypothetical protein LTR69_000398 [Exophiala sideris]KAK5187581.1 hypothetical protein LTR44_000397 [Eurotiomycetes sp. CCFEE 6388]